MNISYASLATDEYICGIICLLKSIRRQTNLPVTVIDLGLSEENKRIIEELGYTCWPAERITSAKAKKQPWHCTEDFANVCYNKLHLWSMSFEKVIYLDADMIMLKNMDHLFERDTGEFAAVPSFAFQQGSDGSVVSKYWDTNYFNAGLLVLKPDMSIFEDLLWLKDSLTSRCNPLDTTDQSFLNEYYKGRWHRLDRMYNGYKRIYQMFPELWGDLKDVVYTIHYNLEKPWNTREEDCDGLEKIWWRYFNAEL